MRHARLGCLLLAVISTAFGLVLVTSSPAAAHAVVTNSTPTDGQILAVPPNEVQVQFSEKVSSELGGLTVLNSDGERVDNDDSNMGGTGLVLGATVQPDLADGTYVMNYRVISADGHPINGAIVFGVGEQTVVDTSGVSALAAGDDSGFEFAAGVARFVTYMGALLAAGLALFLTFIHDQRPDRFRLTPIVRMAAVIGGIGSVATVAIQAALLTGEGFSAMTDVSTLRQALTEGLDWATVVLLFGLALVHLSTDTPKPVVSQGLAFYGSLAVASSFALWGHSTTAEPRWLAFISDFVHVGTAAVWLGGLVGLALTLWHRRRQVVVAAAPVSALVTSEGVAAAGTGGGGQTMPSEPPDELLTGADGDHDVERDVGIAASTARIVSRFSSLAAIMLFLLAVAGVALAWNQLGSLDALGSTTYGRALLIKIGIVLLIVVGAAYNRWRLVPRIEQDEAAEQAHGAVGATALQGTAWRHLTTSVVAEILGIVLVLGVTSVLVNITPPKNASAETATTAQQSAPVREATVEVQLTPAQVGGNSVHITYFDSGGSPVDMAQQVSVEMNEPEQGIGPIQREAVKAATGHYIIDGLQIPTAGTWELTLVTRVSDFEQERTTLAYTVTS